MKRKIFFNCIKKYLLATLVLNIQFLIFCFNLSAQLPNSWVQRADFPGTARLSATGFFIGSKGYVGTGEDSTGNLLADFWEYDPSSNSWTQLSDFAGVARRGAVGFSIGTKGYIGTGFDGTNNLKDFWEYNPSTGTWTQKRSLGGVINANPRREATSFVINNKGYVATGFDGTPNYNKECWQYDGDTTWIKKTDVGIGLQFSYRRWASGFAIDSFGYVGCGRNYSQDWKNDFWRYNVNLNTWSQMANYAGTPRGSAVSFTMHGKGYVGIGNDDSFRNDFWQYDPASNSWTEISEYGGGAVSQGIAFSISGNGYVGLGRDSVTFRNDFWMYTPDSTIGINEQTKESIEATVFPNPFSISTSLKINEPAFYPGSYSYSLYDIHGNKIREELMQKNTITIERKNLRSGIYFYSIRKKSNPKIYSTGKIVIN